MTDLLDGRTVLLHGKKPFQSGWPTRVVSPEERSAHLAAGGNVGNRCGDGLVVLDFDIEEARLEMCASLGDLPVTVRTGSGKAHSYVTYTGTDLPAKIMWKGVCVGECQRTNAQQVVCPPSLHPGTGKPYTWVVYPPVIGPLPDAWRTQVGEVGFPVLDRGRPAWIKEGDRRGIPEPEPWGGPSAEVILEAARRQPNAKARRNGIKFVCTACRRSGRDRHGDNGFAALSGHWSCAVDPSHKRDIAVQLGFGR